MKHAVWSMILVSFTLLDNCVSSGPRATPAVQRAAAGNARSPKLLQSTRLDEQGAQTLFGAEEKIKHPADLPEDVLQVLKDNERIKSRMAELPKGVTSTSFAASEIDLSDKDRSDLIVQAIDPRLFGANLIPLWIFRRTPTGYELVLSVDALGLEVLNTKTRGYKNIRTTKVTAKEVLVSVYEFDGIKYAERRSSREPT